MMKTLVCFGLALLATVSLADEPYILVLGVAQDAGYPQAACFRPHCMPGWQDRDKRITASSIAVVGRDASYLFDATPHFPDQLYRLNSSAPDAPLDGIFLTHAHMGHYTGLMHLGREAMGAKAMPVFAMPRMKQFLENNGPWSQLVGLQNIALRPLQDASPVNLGAITVTPFAVPHRDEYSETVGYRIDGPNKSAVFIPDIDKWEKWETDIVDVVRDVDYALLDATFFADGELPNRAMSEVPHPFVVESMALFERLPADEKQRVVFIHMNHTNPMLDPDSEASEAVTSAGYRIAREGLRLAL
ncbi:MAG: MBL fold metallo-hydrolase [Pseudomonadota bacterium]